MTVNHRKSVLVVDDEYAMRHGLRRALPEARYDVVTSPNGPDALAKVAERHFDAIISDIGMPEMNGIDFVRILHKKSPDSAVIMLTAAIDPDRELEQVAREAGAIAYLSKPCKIDRIVKTIESALDGKAAYHTAHPAAG